MGLLTGLATAVFLYTLVRGCVLLLDTKANLRWIEKKQDEMKGGDSLDHAELPKIILCVPALREQRELPELLSHLLKIDYPREKLQILIVTTEREIVERSPSSEDLEMATTVDMAAEMVEQINNELQRRLFFHLHSLDREGNKATQLNFALAELDNALGWADDNDTYFGVYDADSRPDIRTLRFIGLDAVQHGSAQGEIPPVYQQVSLYTKNFSTLPKGVAGHLLRAEALFQTRWSIAYEISNFQSQVHLLRKRQLSLTDRVLKSKLNYCIGHGCFVRLDLLKRINGFPDLTPTEDLPLGNIFSLMGVAIKPVPFFDVCEVPDSVSLLFNQAAVWFASSMTIFSTIASVYKAGYRRHDTLRSLSLAVQRTAMHISWGLGGFIYLTCLLGIAVIHGSLKLLCFGLIAGLLYTVGGLALLLVQWNKLSGITSSDAHPNVLSKKQLCFALICSLAKPVTNCIGPTLFAMRWTRSRLTSQQLLFPKTERNA